MQKDTEEEEHQRAWREVQKGSTLSQTTVGTLGIDQTITSETEVETKGKMDLEKISEKRAEIKL